MQSIKEIYKIGYGPSSSHTMGPQKAASLFLKHYPNLVKVDVYLYGSLALTGKGHLTDEVLIKTFSEIDHQIYFDFKKENLSHENTFKFIGILDNDKKVTWHITSVGGGDIIIDELDDQKINVKEVYIHENMSDIQKYCKKNNLKLIDYIYKFEDENKLKKHLNKCWEVMNDAINRGIETDGILPGVLKVKRNAKILAKENKDDIVAAYAYSVNEENASGGKIVTAPTCGACGTLPAILRYYQEKYKFSNKKIIDALAIAGLFGNIVKNNATISGAVAGCQAEVGVATSMAAAAIAFLKDYNNSKIEAAAEIAMEHQLGLTCDPIYGYVQIPCIQRNAVATQKAIIAAKIANTTFESKKITFDMVIDVMYSTGKEMSEKYRETSLGGLAKLYKEKNK